MWSCIHDVKNNTGSTLDHFNKCTTATSYIYVNLKVLKKKTKFSVSVIFSFIIRNFGWKLREIKKHVINKFNAEIQCLCFFGNIFFLGYVL